MEKPQYCRVSSVVFRHSGFLWKSVCREIGLENVINRIYQNALFGYSKGRELYMKRKNAKQYYDSSACSIFTCRVRRQRECR